ncbi:cell division protein FtsZ [Candidatus Endoriftia persephone]|jgi:cell division protein FtsZ|uniref:Cell division protein FtsZ n=3 Tax=Gammaproteobacteria TaxID=1236 RepID=G2FES7_9GAMM|nr:cell division protein FtsZ [Candidatus Endoriftia persephone]EGV51650.1 cell division protein ftsZ [endosymbiont of Riftia pachyptila (vent Ph05)]EGW54659.1 cell division protein FtsZ [endosymbiont of Tevnia jerichonana (vent Tica)]USF88458.1 cell division protein FtsZ [Candidatus Endoriftia persephone]
MFELLDTHSTNAVIKVIGVGGGGGNAVNHMVNGEIEGVDFICANTDAQALRSSEVRTLLQLGSDITKGLGAGANPEIGRQAAQDDRDRIVEVLEGADMIFITAGMGGGTGTGAAPVVAEIAKEMGVLTVAVVTKPFAFEGGRRMKVAEAGIEELAKCVDSLITIPNEKLLAVLGKDMSLLNAFKAANDVLLNAVQGIAELITRPGLINVDFADVKTVMSEMGSAMMGSGEATGENRAREAAERAIRSPLLEDINLSGAKGILVNITAGLNLAIGEFDEVGSTVREFADDDATVVVGTVIDPEMQDEMRVTVVATGLGEIAQIAELPSKRQEEPKAAPPVTLVDADVGFGDHERDYAALDKPAIVRNKTQAKGGVEPATPPDDFSYLDVPAFLRKQAD